MMTPRLTCSAVSAIVGAVASAPGCYLGFGVGPTYPQNRSVSTNGANTMTDLGLVFDYERVVRVMYARSLQLYGGALYTVDGQQVIAPLANTLEVAVTAYRWPSEVYLRPMARVQWGSDVRVGAEGEEVKQPNSSTVGGLLGASVLLAGDNQGLGHFGLSVSAGLLVARSDAAAMGRTTFLAPMVLLGWDFFPPFVFRCWLLDEKCPHYFRGVKN
jgi:hypothetical protein